MRVDRTRRGRGSLLAALLLLSPLVLAMTLGATAGEPTPAESAALAAAMVQYHRALEAYNRAQHEYAAALSAYWTKIATKRHLRTTKRAANQQISIEDYVLDQPPVYTGSVKPPNPSGPSEGTPPRHEIYVPVVADFVTAAQQEFEFTPRLPRTDSEFKRAYAKTALAAGLRPDQAIRIYSFEAGGDGDYDVEAGLEHDKSAHAITTALGYNQLLATNTVEIVAENGLQFIKALQTKAARLPDDEKDALRHKIEIVRRMVEFCRSVPDDWGRHEALASTPKGLAVHALNLDLDVGPLLQTQKLLNSVVFARRKGFTGSLSAAELEMMNLTGDGNGFDMVTMPAAWRHKVPTANFFQRNGYLDNPVAKRNNVVATLIAAIDARMNQEVDKPGARELASAFQARENLRASE